MRRRNPRRSPRGAAPATHGSADEQPETWYRIANFVRSDTTVVYLFGEIGYWGVTASDFVRELATVSAPNIELHISSGGGDVFEALAIYNALRQHPARIVVMIDGLAASAASFIAMAGDIIKIARNASMMIHEASGSCYGNASEMQTMAELLDGVSANIADIYAQRAGGTVEAWRDLMRAESWYHTGPDAVAAGLADEVDDDQDDEDDDEEEGQGQADDRVAAGFDRLRPAARGQLPALLPPPTRPATVSPGPAATAVVLEMPSPNPDAPAPGADSPPAPSVVVNISGAVRSEQEIVDIVRDAFDRFNGTARAARTPAEDVEGEAAETPSVPDAPPPGPPEVAAEYNPGQKRDGHGRWTDGMPDILTATTVNLHGGDLAMERHKDGTVTLTTEQGSITLPEGGNEKLRKALASARLTEPGQERKVKRDDGTTAILIQRRDDDFLDIKTNPDGLSDDDLRATAGLRATEDDLTKAEHGSLRVDAAKRLDTGNGPTDIYLTDDNGFAFRMMDDSGAAVEKKFDGRSFAKVMRGLDVVVTGFDDRDEDGPDISKVTVPTNLGDIDVELVGEWGASGDGNQLRIVPTDPGAGWGVNVAGEHQGKFVQAFAQIEEIADDWLGVYEADEWKQLARRLLARVEAAAADSWDALTSGLLAAPAPDSWAALTGGLLTPATDVAWADLTEALL